MRQWCNEGRLRLGNGAMREVRWGKGAMREERWGGGVIKKERWGKGVMKKERWGKSAMNPEERWGNLVILREKDEANVQWSGRNMMQRRWVRKDKWRNWIFAKPELDPEYCVDEKREHQSRSSTFQPRKLEKKIWMYFRTLTILT